MGNHSVLNYSDRSSCFFGPKETGVRALVDFINRLSPTFVGASIVGKMIACRVYGIGIHLGHEGQVRSVRWF